jgi:hypothetical protein
MCDMYNSRVAKEPKFNLFQTVASSLQVICNFDKFFGLQLTTRSYDSHIPG